MRYVDVFSQLEKFSKDEGKPFYTLTMVDGDTYKLSEKNCRKAVPYIIDDYLSESSINYAFGRKWKRQIKDLIRIHREMDGKFGGKKMTKRLKERFPVISAEVCSEKFMEDLAPYIKKKLY